MVDESVMLFMYTLRRGWLEPLQGGNDGSEVIRQLTRIHGCATDLSVNDAGLLDAEVDLTALELAYCLGDLCRRNDGSNLGVRHQTTWPEDQVRRKSFSLLDLLPISLPIQGSSP